MTYQLNYTYPYHVEALPQIVTQSEEIGDIVEEIAREMSTHYADVFRHAIDQLTSRDITPNVLNAILVAMEEEDYFVTSTKEEKEGR